MRRLVLALILLGIAPLAGPLADPAEAQALRTWVSGLGDDVNPCSRTAPCKTFAGAISKTFINGEINCIDPGGFGAITITKSITIDCGHVDGSILAASTTGVIINIPVNANDPNRSARIRGLSINGTGFLGTAGTRTGVDGVRILQAASVVIEKTVIQDFKEQGIEVAASANVTLFVNEVQIRNCNGSGIRLATTSGLVVATINDVEVSGCPVGLHSIAARVGVRDSLFTNNAAGIQTTGTASVIIADDVMVIFASTAVIANGGSTIRLSDSIITQSGVGLNANGGAIVSSQHNNIVANGTNGVFTSTEGKL